MTDDAASSPERQILKRLRRGTTKPATEGSPVKTRKVGGAASGLRTDEKGRYVEPWKATSSDDGPSYKFADYYESDESSPDDEDSPVQAPAFTERTRARPVQAPRTNPLQWRGRLYHPTARSTVHTEEGLWLKLDKNGCMGKCTHTHTHTYTDTRTH
jgi:hypothetical protein